MSPPVEMAEQVIHLDEVSYWVGGQRRRVRDHARTELIRNVEYAAHVLRGERLALLERVAQLLDDDRVIDLLLAEDGRDYLVPRRGSVRVAVRAIARVCDETEAAYPRHHEPVLGYLRGQTLAPLADEASE